MNKFVPATLTAAALVIVAVVGYNLLPRSNQVGPPAQTTSTPSPSPAPLAVGNFTSHGASIQLDASGDGAAVTGTMTVSDDGGSISVDLGCARTTDGGLVMIGGPVTDSTNALAPKDSRLAIVLQRGSPVKALFWFQHDDPAAANCSAFLESIPDVGESGLDTSTLEPIAGTLQLRP